MPDGVQLVQVLVWGGLAAAWFARMRSLAQARARRDAGVEQQTCTRCGVGLESTLARGTRSMCEDCLRSTRRGYRAGSWFFLGLGGLFALAAPFTIIPEYGRFGLNTAISDAALFMVMIALAIGIGLGIRYAEKRLT